MANDLALSVRHLTKVFGGTVALSDGNLEVRPGEIHGLLGENGAGKSTLIKVLAGVHQADGGAVSVSGRQLPPTYGPDDARSLGLAFIHQDLGLVSELSVAENIALVVGFGKTGRPIRWGDVNDRASMVLRTMDVDLDVTTPVSDLPLATRATIAIARALAADANVLILDEPTASLAAGEVAALFKVLRRLREVGIAMVFVSHRMDEIWSICDRVTVLRDGRTVGTAATADLDEPALLRMIVGHDIPPAGPAVTRVRGQTRLACSDVRGAVVGPLSFSVEQGEILGVSGLSDSGHLELGELLFGVSRPMAGTMELDAVDYRPRNPRDSIERGVAYVPADRVAAGLMGRMTLRENLFANPNRAQEPYRRRKRVHPLAERRAAGELLRRFDVRPPDPEREADTLSGGNAQKVLLAKWLSVNPRLIVLNEPTTGVDVGARDDIYRVVQREVSNDSAAIILTSDFEEAVQLCTRVLVLYRGLLSAELTGEQISVAEISSAALSLRGEA